MKTSNKYSGRKLVKPDMTKEGHFTQIPNAFILNPNIRNPELRLLQFILMNKENRIITTKNCVKYLGKTKPAISKSFEKLIELGILKITDEHIEIMIPEGMKEYKVGYLKGKENITNEVKKTLQEDIENFTNEVKKTNKKPLEVIDNVNNTSPIILYNNRELPVSAKSGDTEQTHLNDNTKGKAVIELGLECDSHQSQASPSVLAPLLHTPNVEVEMEGKESSLPIVDELQQIEELSEQPIENEIPIKPDKSFAEEVATYNSSKYFLPNKLNEVRSLYSHYAETYPNGNMSILDFEHVLVYLMLDKFEGMVKLKGINFCLIYPNDIRHYYKYIPQYIEQMMDNMDETRKLLKASELEK